MYISFVTRTFRLIIFLSNFIFQKYYGKCKYSNFVGKVFSKMNVEKCTCLIYTYLVCKDISTECYLGPLDQPQETALSYKALTVLRYVVNIEKTTVIK